MRRMFRVLTLVAGGGLVLQFAGCAAGLGPAYLGFVESALFAALLGRAISP